MPDSRSGKLLGCPSWRGSAALMVPFYGLTRSNSIGSGFGALDRTQRLKILLSVLGRS